MSKFEFKTRCVECDDVPGLRRTTDTAREVSYQTLKRAVGAGVLRACFPFYTWGHGRAPGLRLGRDRSVTFHASRYQGVRCYVVVWSAIEYIFTERKAA